MAKPFDGTHTRMLLELLHVWSFTSIKRNLRIIFMDILLTVEIYLNVLYAWRSLKLGPLFILIQLMVSVVVRTLVVLNRFFIAGILFFAISNWRPRNVRFHHDNLLLLLIYQPPLIALCGTLLRHLLWIFPVVPILLENLFRHLLIFYNDLIVMILFVYYMFPLTEAPLCALFTLSPLWQLNVLSEALEEETD